MAEEQDENNSNTWSDYLVGLRIRNFPLWILGLAFARFESSQSLLDTGKLPILNLWNITRLFLLAFLIHSYWARNMFQTQCSTGWCLIMHLAAPWDRWCNPFYRWGTWDSASKQFSQGWPQVPKSVPLPTPCGTGYLSTLPQPSEVSWGVTLLIFHVGECGRPHT